MKKTTCLRLYLTQKKIARVKNKANIGNLKKLKKQVIKLLKELSKKYVETQNNRRFRKS